MKRRPLVLVMLFLFFSLNLLDALGLCFFHGALDAKELAPATAAISCVDRAAHPFLSIVSAAQKRTPLTGLEKGAGCAYRVPSREETHYSALTQIRGIFYPPSPIHQFDTVYRI